MRAELTPAVTRALENAQEWAFALGQSEVLPAHVLLGLLQEEEGRPALLLAGAGLERARVHDSLGANKVGPILPPPEAGLPHGLQIQSILYEAQVLAHEVFGEPTVTSERLLLALLRGDEALRQSLQALGLAFDKLEAEVLSSQGPPLQLDEPLQLREPVEDIDTARILDASANRAREAVRVG